MKLKPVLLAAAIAATGIFAASASAADGTITFNGSISGSTCDISSSEGSTANFSVSLQNVSTSAFSTAGDYAARKPFSIQLDNCSGTGNVSAYFEPGSTINSNGNLNNTATGAGAATNVDLQLLNAGANVIDLNSQSNTSTAAIASGSATLDYYVQYHAITASVGAGTVTSTVDYTIIYP